MKIIVRSLLLLSILVCSYGVAAASDQSSVMGTIELFVGGFNRGDARTALTACANPVSIIDEFPPYAWAGPAGCADWAAAYDVNAKKKGITDGFVTVLQPANVTIARNRAYVIAHTKYAWKEHGKPMSEIAARLTVALHKVGGVWQMTAWTWSNI